MTDPVSGTDAAPEAVFRDGLAHGQLRFQKCGRCSAAVFPPRVLCPDCGSDELSWQRSGGSGTVYSTTAVRGRTGAHNVALVDLDEGFRMMSRVDDVEPDRLVIGSRVAFAVTDAEEAPVAVFRKGDRSS